MRLAPTLTFCMVLLACAHARQLQQKVKVSDKPVVCTDAPPPLSDNTWPPECKDAAQGFACKGACAPGFNGQPTAVCGKKGGWAANGACKPAKCDADELPMIANATWDNCDKVPVGSTCNASCDSYLVASGPITVTCEAETKGADWSNTDAFCGTINTQALLNIEGTGSCSEAGTAAVKASVLSYMQGQSGVNELKVDVKCIDNTPARRRLHQSTVRYLIVVIYVGGEAAADNLVQAAESDLNSVGNLATNVNTATGGAITLSQESVSGDYSGGGSTPLNPEQDASVSLLRSGAVNLQTGTVFYLTAVYTGTTGFAQEGVEITGPAIDPEGAVTCTAVSPAPLTDALGTATWTCTTGQTPGKVTLTVEAPNQYSNSTVSASSSLTIGTDCVGSFGEWGACSNVCGVGERSQIYTITTPAADGGRACPNAAGDNRTEACTGPTTCGECQECGAAGCVDKAAGTACAGGQCETGVCQPSVDCVGDFGEFGACSNVCGEGQKTKFYTITTPAAYGGQACNYTTGDNVTETCTGPTSCGECQQCGAAGCEDLANETPCSNLGKCYDGTCQASDQLFEVKSISPSLTASNPTPANNTEWFWMRLYNAGSVIGEISTLASQVDLTTPAAVNGSIVAEAPEDPCTPGSAISTALKMVNPTGSDRAEAGVWYRNNTPSHPPGLFNGMKFKEFIESNGTLTMSWYRGDWASMTVGSAPIFRFSVINPAMLPTAAYAGTRGRLELVWEPTYDYKNIVPTNTWRTETVSLNKGKLYAYMGGYATPIYGTADVRCYEPLSFWLDPSARCNDKFKQPKQHPWFNSTLNTQFFGTEDIIGEGIIWDLRASALNPKSVAYANNLKISTNKGHQFTYVFTN